VTDVKQAAHDDARTQAASQRLWSPRFWPLWALLGLLRVLVLLPVRAQFFLGRLLGKLLGKLASMRGGVVAANLALCFQTFSTSDRVVLCNKHFESLSIMVFELWLAWWASDKRLAKLTQVRGLENLLTPLREGQGVVLLSGHFASQELTGRVVAKHLERVGAVYRCSHHPFFDQ